MKYIVRVQGFAKRFFIAANNFGFIGASKVFFLFRVLKYKGLASVYLKRLDRLFYFRGISDQGVVSHFYKQGYRIVDNGRASRVRYIVDAGANIGDETVRFRYFHPQATIFAVEPEKNNFEILKRNVQNDHQIICLNNGLWSKECLLRVVSGIMNEDFKVVEVDRHEAEHEHDVVAISLERLMMDYNIPEIDILKMDIEGAEGEVFGDMSAMKWISKVKVIIMECPDNDKPGTLFFIFRRLIEANLLFNCYLQGENIILIRNDVDWKLETDLFYEK